MLPCLSRHIQVLTDWNQSQRIICDKTDETLLLTKVRCQPIILSLGIEPKRIQHTGYMGDMHVQAGSLRLVERHNAYLDQPRVCFDQSKVQSSLTVSSWLTTGKDGGVPCAPVLRQRVVRTYSQKILERLNISFLQLPLKTITRGQQVHDLPT